MAETISLQQTFTQTGGTAQATLSGTLTVDYTTGTATSQNGLFLTNSNGMGVTDTFKTFTFTNNGDGTYTISSTSGADNFSINYTGQAPSSLNANRSTAQYQNASYANPSGPVASSQTPCFAQGTRIAVERDGERRDLAVEALRVGDLAVTADGSLHPITWIGSRHLDCRRHPRPGEVMPVRVAAHAFGDNRPARELVLSPGHAVCLDLVGEVLIPISSLINGSTIAQGHVDGVTYWHLALAQHSVILAENMPCESYLEMSNIAFFSVEGAVTALHPSPDVPAGGHGDFCRPFHAEGPIVDLARAAVAGRSSSDAAEGRAAKGKAIAA